MVNALRRMNRLQAKLLSLRHGPGAAVLPPDVTRIHLDFAKNWNDGHLGPRRFWRQFLPRLKYWNPAVPMVVNRTDDQPGPARLSIYLRQAGADSARNEADPLSATQTSSTHGLSKAPLATENERVVFIDMKNQHSDRILHEFLDKTGAVSVTPTSEEAAQIEENRHRQAKAEVDRARVGALIAARKKEARTLANARAEAASLKAAI